MEKPDTTNARKQVELFDHMGRPFKDPIPTNLTATFCQKVFHRGPARVGKYDKAGKTGDAIREELVRAQVPYVCTLFIYDSKFQVEPTYREYFVYAPLEVQKAAELALRLWQRWERPPRDEFTFDDMREVYPKVDDAIVAEPIDDNAFAEHLKDVRKLSKGKMKMAGDPRDPYAFTSLDQDIRMFKTTDVQQGLVVKAS